MIIQIAAIGLTGLAAGLFYSYDCSVVRGLGRLADREFLSAFQSINRAILNPYFFLSFMGSLVMLPIATWVSYNEGQMTSFYCLLAAAVIYGAGVFGITMAGNVPLNNILDKFDIVNASAEAMRRMRQKFEVKWNRFQHARTYAAILAFILSIISLTKRS